MNSIKLVRENPDVIEPDINTFNELSKFPTENVDIIEISGTFIFITVSLKKYIIFLK